MKEETDDYLTQIAEKCDSCHIYAIVSRRFDKSQLFFLYFKNLLKERDCLEEIL